MPSPLRSARRLALILSLLLPASGSLRGADALTIGPAVEIRFDADASRAYQLQGSGDLQRWVDVGAPVVAEAGPRSQLLAASSTAEFYRLDTAAVRDLNATLEPIRTQRKLPALACVVIQSNRITGLGAVGLRKWNVQEPVTVRDKWHHGSITKSITATLAARLVEAGRIQWTNRLRDLFPEKVAAMNAAWPDVTLELLLANRSGAPGDLGTSGIWTELWNFGGTPREARLLLLDRVTALAPNSTPGTQYEYSNAGFAMAGAMLERAMNQPWESLLAEWVFKPLHMDSAGFGVPATPRHIDQPWGHVLQAGFPLPMAPGTDADNPPAIGPAGTVHASIVDLARYVAMHLAGARGETGLLLTPASFAKLHTAVAGQDYALGWNVASRPWAGGRVLTHTGSNLQWFTNIWIAPDKNWACIVLTNYGGAGAFEATDAVVGQLITLFL